MHVTNYTVRIYYKHREKSLPYLSHKKVTNMFTKDEPVDNNKSNFDETVFQLFSNGNNIRIPPYHRAYSWGEKHCSQFLEDLVEQKGKKYYLGQFLFEKDGNTLFVIDGQQRLTTTILFISAIAKSLHKKGFDTESIKNTYLTDVFKTIDDDQIVFKKATQKHFVSTIKGTETISQKKIIQAFALFELKSRELNVEELETIRHTLEHAVITSFYISNKIEATQVFEYQNNRGIKLSQIESMKAYLMRQVYIQSKNSSDANIEISKIQRDISEIYRNIEAVQKYW
jgi:uncharacterized protein with ParB-like and HNH nuclease domain